jgi:two-component system cell cycle response regulator DivK
MGKRVLVVEDDEDNRRIVTKILSLDGYEIAEAVDGAEALVMAREWHPDLILLDLGLPGLNGWEVERQIKADAALRAIPTIALTAFAMRGDEEQARAAGCDDYLPKPARPAEIRQIVSKYLDGPDGAAR